MSMNRRALKHDNWKASGEEVFKKSMYRLTWDDLVIQSLAFAHYLPLRRFPFWPGENHYWLLYKYVTLYIPCEDYSLATKYRPHCSQKPPSDSEPSLYSFSTVMCSPSFSQDPRVNPACKNSFTSQLNFRSRTWGGYICLFLAHEYI